MIELTLAREAWALQTGGWGLDRAQLAEGGTYLLRGRWYLILVTLIVTNIMYYLGTQ